VLGELMRAIAGSSSSSSSSGKASGGSSSSSCGSIDSKAFAKLFKGAPGVLSAQFSAADADLIFVKLKVSLTFVHTYIYSIFILLCDLLLLLQLLRAVCCCISSDSTLE
jgi:hypothetical protein